MGLAYKNRVWVQVSHESAFTLHPDAHTFYASVNNNRKTLLFLVEQRKWICRNKNEIETIVSRGNLPSLEKELVTNFGQGWGCVVRPNRSLAGCSLWCLCWEWRPIGPEQGGEWGDCWNPETSVGTGGWLDYTFEREAAGSILERERLCRRSHQHLCSQTLRHFPLLYLPYLLTTPQIITW